MSNNSPDTFSRSSTFPKMSHMGHTKSNISEKSTKLQESATVHWLRKRHQNTTNLNYLMRPTELQQHSDVQSIFKVFDEDNSGKLDMGEFYNLLKHANISIDMEDLKEFYKRVDDTKDSALDFKEFKNCTLSDEANLHFSNMMKKAIIEAKNGGDGSNSGSDGKNKPFLPKTFGHLLNYLNYENRKEKMMSFVKDEKNNAAEKLRKFQELIDLQMGKDVYQESFSKRFSSHSPDSISAKRSAKRYTDVLKTTSSFIASETYSDNEQISLDNIRPSRNILTGEKIIPLEQEEILGEAKQVVEDARENGIKEFSESVLPNRERRTVRMATSGDLKNERKSLFANQAVNRPLGTEKSFDNTNRSVSFYGKEGILSIRHQEPEIIDPKTSQIITWEQSDDPANSATNYLLKNKKEVFSRRGERRRKLANLLMASQIQEGNTYSVNKLTEASDIFDRNNSLPIDPSTGKPRLISGTRVIKTSLANRSVPHLYLSATLKPSSPLIPSGVSGGGEGLTSLGTLTIGTSSPTPKILNPVSKNFDEVIIKNEKRCHSGAVSPNKVMKSLIPTCKVDLENNTATNDFQNLKGKKLLDSEDSTPSNKVNMKSRDSLKKLFAQPKFGTMSPSKIPINYGNNSAMSPSFSGQVKRLQTAKSPNLTVKTNYKSFFGPNDGPKVVSSPMYPKLKEAVSAGNMKKIHFSSFDMSKVSPKNMLKNSICLPRNEPEGRKTLKVSKVGSPKVKVDDTRYFRPVSVENVDMKNSLSISGVKAWK